MLNVHVAHGIRIFHYFFVVFMLVTPFMSNNVEVLDLHAKIALVLILKWLLKWWECGFTLLEHKIRGGRKEDGFMYQILNPLFNISQRETRILIFVVMILLMAISFNKSITLRK